MDHIQISEMYPHKKHFEANMWNVSFVQYPSVPAFTEGFGLVSIQFQISSGYLLNFHLG